VKEHKARRPNKQAYLTLLIDDRETSVVICSVTIQILYIPDNSSKDYPLSEDSKQMKIFHRNTTRRLEEIENSIKKLFPDVGLDRFSK
jgi:hypothetical protein